MRDKIWAELTDAKFTQIYAEITCQVYKTISNIVDILTILFSSCGVIMGLKIWKGENGSFYACIIITIVQVAKLAAPKMFPYNKDHNNLNKVIDSYYAYYTELEKIWYDFNHDIINEKIAKDKFYKLRDKQKSILKTVNDVLSDNNRLRKQKAERETNNYFKTHHPI